MKKGFFYYCLAVSLVFHLLLVFLFKLDKWENKEKEPVAIDLVGPAKWGPKTRLPEPRKDSEEAPTAGKSVAGRMLERLRPARPSLPPMPIPVQPSRPAAPPSFAKVPGGPPSKGDIRTPGEGQGAPSPPEQRPQPATQPSAPPQAAETPARPEPKRLALPSQDDLMRYAKVDKDLQRERFRGEETITLDTDDLLYTSYLQGLKTRIEQIWKYPETARRDGIQGNLVMKFSIGKSGRVENVELIKSSGYAMLDDAAKRALMDASPFNPLPDNWKKDYFTITGTFVYRLYGLYLR